MKPRSILNLGFPVLAAAVVACTDASEKVSNCVERGVQYFNEIEAWPMLSDGRDAEKVAAERCSRSPVAFP